MSVFDLTSPSGIGDAKRAGRRMRPKGNPFGTFNAAGQATSVNPYSNIDPYQQFLNQNQPTQIAPQTQSFKGRTTNRNVPTGAAPEPGMGGGSQQQNLEMALGMDTFNMQQAADEQHALLGRQTSAMEDILGGLSSDFMGPSNQFGMEMDQYAQKAEQLGTLQYDQTEGRVRDMLGDVKGQIGRGDPSGDIDRANAFAEAATTGFQDAIAEYQDRSAQDASAMASAIRRNGHSQLMMARAGIHPDGTPMTAAEQAAVTAEVQWSTETAVQEQITPILSRFNDTLVSLKKGLADLKMGQANTALQGGQLRSQYGLNGAEVLQGAHMGGISAMAQAGEQQAKMMEMGAMLKRAKADLSSAAQLNAVNLEMQGRSEVSRMIQNNPRSIVSWFQGLMALYAARVADSNTQPTASPQGRRGGRGSPNMDRVMKEQDSGVPRGTKKGGSPNNQKMSGYNRRTDGATPVRTPENTSWVQGPTRPRR